VWNVSEHPDLFREDLKKHLGELLILMPTLQTQVHELIVVLTRPALLYDIEYLQTKLLELLAFGSL